MVNNITHPIALIEMLIASALNRTPLACGLIKAIKITKRGIYVYSNISYTEVGEVNLIGETTIFSDTDARIPVAEIGDYIQYRPRLKLIKHNNDNGVRILISEATSIAKSPDVESEDKFDTATYLIVRDLYPSNTEVGKSRISKFKLREGHDKLDAKLFLLDYQFKSREDKILYTLLSNGYNEGFCDTFTNILYGKDKNGELHELAMIFTESSTGVREFDYTRLGIRMEATGIKVQLQTNQATHSVRYKIPALTQNTIAVEHFKEIKELKNGIILVNNVLPDDLINCIYNYNGKDVSKVFSLLVLDQIRYNYFNPYLIIESIRMLTNSESADDPVKALARIKSEALSVDYNAIILEGMNNLNSEIVNVADRSLVFIIDDFKSLSDIQKKLEGIAIDTTWVMSKVKGVLDIDKISYFKMNPTMTDIITTLDPCGKDINTVSYIKVDDEYKNFNSYILDLLRDDNLDRLLVNEHGLRLMYNDTSVTIIDADISFNNMISFLAGISNTNIYKVITTKPIARVLLDVDLSSYCIKSYMEEGKITIIAQRLNSTIIDEQYLPALFEETHGGKLTYILKGDGTLSLNSVVFTLVYKIITEEKKLLLIDPEYSINEEALPMRYRRYLEVLHTTDQQTVQDIVNSIKPSVVLLHKVNDAKSVSVAYQIAPLVKQLLITSRFMNFHDIYINFIMGNIDEAQFKYYTNNQFYEMNSDNKFNTYTVGEVLDQ